MPPGKTDHIRTNSTTYEDVQSYCELTLCKQYYDIVNPGFASNPKKKKIIFPCPVIRWQGESVTPIRKFG